MKLVASVIVDEQVEQGRYLDVFLDHLHDFCDETVIVRDRDGDLDIDFFAHEGHARQSLLSITLAREPTHVLAIDADEFIADGPGLRRTIERNPDVGAWWLEMQEVWELDQDCLCVRFDGGWIPHPIPAVWRVPDRLDWSWRIRDRALACGRVPAAVDALPAAPATTDILHFGWTNEQERQARYDRYTLHDGGRFHASRHLQSIMWPPEQIDLRGRTWPASLDPHRAAISGRAGSLTR